MNTTLKTPRIPSVAALLNPRFQRVAFATFLALIVGAAFVKSWGKATTPSRLGDLTRTAILRWKPQIEDLGRGVNIYETHNYPNPPIMALILRPIVAGPPAMTFAVWFLIKVGLAALMVRWAISLVGGALPDWLVMMAVLLSLHPIIGDLTHGNVNLFIAALVFGSLELLRRRWDGTAGIVLALAIACKVTPALFLPFFIWKRLGTAVLGTIIGLALWVAVVPGIFLGAESTRTLTVSWFTTMVKPFVIDGKITSEHPNQSVPGVVFRLFTSEPSFLTYGEDGNGPPEAAGRHTLVDLGTGTARKISQAFTIGFGLLIVLVCRVRSCGPEGMRQGVAFAAECSLILLGMLLLSERTWKHHAVTLVLPMLTLLADWHVRGRSSSLMCVAGAAMLMLGQSALPEEGQNLALVYGVYTAAFAILTGGVVSVLATRHSWPNDSPARSLPVAG